MKVIDIIERTLKNNKMHMTLLDPDKQVPEKAAALAEKAVEYGSDAIMIGGSTGVTSENMDATIRAIKSRIEKPVIIFPTSAGALSPSADAIYFMSLMNSKSPVFLVRQQMIGAPIIKKMGIEPIPMGYIVVEPGMKVGEIGMADVIPRTKPELAASYAMAAEMFGLRLVYLEAGSGAPEPVPSEMIKAVHESVNIPLIVGGGIRDAESARIAVSAGADIVVTGTVAEDHKKLYVLRDIVKAVKS